MLGIVLSIIGVITFLHMEDDVVVGYAYAGSFHSREAYKHSAELSVYVRQDMRGKGIGRSLYFGPMSRFSTN